MPYVSVMMQSMVRNAKNERNHDFYILSRLYLPDSKMLGKVKSFIGNKKS